MKKNEIGLITLTRDPSNIKWYKNGYLVRSRGNSYPNAQNSVNNITIADGYTTNYLGEIYCMLLYERSLTPQEVLQNYNATRSRFGL